MKNPEVKVDPTVRAVTRILQDFRKVVDSKIGEAAANGKVSVDELRSDLEVLTDELVTVEAKIGEVRTAFCAADNVLRERFGREVRDFVETVGVLTTSLSEKVEGLQESKERDRVALRSDIDGLSKLFSVLRDEVDARVVNITKEFEHYATLENFSEFKSTVDARQDRTSSLVEKLQKDMETLESGLDAISEDLEGLDGYPERVLQVATSVGDLNARFSQYESSSKKSIEEIAQTVTDSWEKYGVLVNELNAHRSSFEEAKTRLDASSAVLTNLSRLQTDVAERVEVLEQLTESASDKGQEFFEEISGRFQAIEGSYRLIHNKIDREKNDLEKSTVEKFELLDEKFREFLTSTRSSIGELRNANSANETFQSETGERISSLVERLGSLTERLDQGLRESNESAQRGYEDFDARLNEHFELYRQAMEVLEGSVGERISSTEGRLSKLVAENLSRAREWIPSGPAYEDRSVVRWRNGTWIATERTSSTPGDDGTWGLVANGIHDIEVRQKPGTTDYVVVVEMSSGTVLELPVLGQSYSYEGTWEQGRTYKRHDVVLRDGHSHVCIVETSTADPTKTKSEWQLLALRGARGRKGETGDMPDMSDVLKAYGDHLMRGDGTPTIRFRGRWQYQEAYSPGDIANFDGGLWICSGANTGEVPPSGTSGTPNEDWAVFFSVSAGRGLTSVSADPNPVLGGNLRTNGNQIHIDTDDGSPVGQIGSAIAPYGDLVYFAHVGEDGYTADDGAIALLNGAIELHGASALVPALKHTNPLGRQLYVSQDGYLYAVDPPEPGWTERADDPGSYDLGSGTGLGPWVELTGTVVTLPENVSAGVRLDVASQIWMENKSGTWSGNVEVGYGIDGVEPTDGDVVAIAGGFAGYINDSFFTTDHGGLSAGQTVTLWARRTSGLLGPFGIDCIGTPNNHSLVLYKA